MEGFEQPLVFGRCESTVAPKLLDENGKPDE